MTHNFGCHLYEVLFVLIVIYAECQLYFVSFVLNAIFAGCHSDVCHYAENILCRMLFMLILFMLSVSYAACQLC
jgi:hypothetical protein